MKTFISYSHTNRAKVEELASILTRAGHDVWFDEEIFGGEDWWKSIITSIKKCDIFIFALSPQSTNSPACRAEYSYALDLNKPILPIMLQIAELPTGKLQTTQYIDGRNLKNPDVILALNKAINRLSENIVTGQFPMPNPLPNEPMFPFPPDQLSEVRDKFKDLKSLSEDELVNLVYHIQSIAISSKRTSKEARELLRKMIVDNPSLPYGVIELARATLKSLPQNNKRRDGLLSLTTILFVILILVILLLSNFLPQYSNFTISQPTHTVSQSTRVTNQPTPTTIQPTLTTHQSTLSMVQPTQIASSPINFPVIMSNYDWDAETTNTYIWNGDSFSKILSGKGNDAALSPDHLRLAYDNAYSNSIWVINIDGSSNAQLTDTDSDNLFPSWSPDGKKIIFSKRYKQENYKIYIMDSDGKNQHLLLDTSQNEIFPIFSPDGQTIAFVGTADKIPSTRDASLWFGQLYTVHIDGSDIQMVPNAARVSYPAWSPDGKRLVFHSDNGVENSVRQIYVINADGTGLISYSKGIRPNWSHDGITIFFSQQTGHHELKIFELDTNNPKSVPTYVEVPDDTLEWIYNFNMLPH